MSQNRMEAEETNSGIKKRGKLKEIAEFSREVKDALEEVCEEKDEVDCFDHWKPDEKDGEKDLEKKTVREASLPKTKVEEKSEGFKRDFRKAKEKFKNYLKGSKGSESRGKERKKVLGAFKKFFMPFTSKTLKMIRKIEESVYKNFMFKFNPYYFDAKKFSAELRGNEDEFEMKIHTPDNKYRNALRQKFAAKE